MSSNDSSARRPPPLVLAAVQLSILARRRNDVNGQADARSSIQAYNAPILSFRDANRLFLAIELSRLLR